MHVPKPVAVVFFVLATAALVGCGTKPKLAPVGGKVTHGGKAVSGGSVWFHREGGNESDPERMSGQLQLDGTFVARTFPHGDGIPPGTYRVTLSPDLAARAGVPRYGNISTTPWIVDVPANGLSDRVFEIK
jgi:hypothetical protein